jgi:hypothetical protein
MLHDVAGDSGFCSFRVYPTLVHSISNANVYARLDCIIQHDVFHRHFDNYPSLDLPPNRSDLSSTMTATARPMVPFIYHMMCLEARCYDYLVPNDVQIKHEVILWSEYDDVETARCGSCDGFYESVTSCDKNLLQRCVLIQYRHAPERNEYLMGVGLLSKHAPSNLRVTHRSSFQP